MGHRPTVKAYAIDDRVDDVGAGDGAGDGAGGVDLPISSARVAARRRVSCDELTEPIKHE